MDNKQILEWLSKNPDKVLKDLESITRQSETIVKGIEKVKDSVLSNTSDVNIRKQLHVTMKSLSTVTDMVRKLAMINMVIVSRKNFQKDSKNNPFKNNSDMNDLFGGMFG